jgi:hypothetical protein
VTALWFAIAIALIAAGLLTLARAAGRDHRGSTRPDVEGYGPNGAYRRTEGALFEPVTDPTPQPPTHWHTGDNP